MRSDLRTLVQFSAFSHTLATLAGMGEEDNRVRRRTGGQGEWRRHQNRHDDRSYGEDGAGGNVLRQKIGAVSQFVRRGTTNGAALRPGSDIGNRNIESSVI